MQIASAGSCFAQHIGKALKKNGFNYTDVEPAPDFLPEEEWNTFGYGIYSARYGNIYSVRQMLQLAQRAFGKFSPTESAWEHNGGVVDPFRPTIEPEPFTSVEELETCQRTHLQSVAELLSTTDLLIFTLGLTESFFSRKDGSVFPVCPGVSGGTFSDKDYQFVNFSYTDVVSDFNKLKLILEAVNPNIRYLLTVSPVPLVATATGNNVGVATTYSKSVLRAAAGFLSDDMAQVDYFPSYEIISMPASQGMFFEKNKRLVTSEGVAHVMANVLQSFKTRSSTNSIGESQHTTRIHPDTESQTGDHDKGSAFCDEELIAQFGTR